MPLKDFPGQVFCLYFSEKLKGWDCTCWISWVSFTLELRGVCYAAFVEEILRVSACPAWALVAVNNPGCRSRGGFQRAPGSGILGCSGAGGWGFPRWEGSVRKAKGQDGVTDDFWVVWGDFVAAKLCWVPGAPQEPESEIFGKAGEGLEEQVRGKWLHVDREPG